MISSLLALFQRDVVIAIRQGSATLLVVAFFLVAITLFPLGIGPDLVLLQRIAPGLIWVSALLSVLLSLDRLFQSDYEDGALDLLLLGPAPLELVVGAKVLAHWLTSTVPLIVAALPLALFLNISLEGLGPLALSLLLGTPTLSLVGAIGAALSLGIRRGGVLLPLLVLPFYVPVLIFGTAAVDAAVAALGVGPYLVILLALLIPAIVLAPLAAAAAIRAAI